MKNGKTLQVPVLRQDQYHLERMEEAGRRQGAPTQVQGVRQEIHNQTPRAHQRRRCAMTSAMLETEVQFHVGDVRVTLWYDPASCPNGALGSSHKVTVEQRGPTGNYEYADVLNASEIPKAILALKKAHDYLKRRDKEGAPALDFHSATERAPERIP